MSAENEFEKLIKLLTKNPDVISSQMFGKLCLKVKGKAFLALHKDTLVFKLAGDAHKKALAQTGAVLWDPSAKGRPMKEWVAIPVESLGHSEKLAKLAMNYVAESV